MTASEATSRAAVLDAARAISDEGLVVGTVGNVSVRIDDLVIVTPTRFAYSEMKADDLVCVDLDGELRSNRRAPSRELPLHLAVYRARPEIEAVVHTHSTSATAWSFLGEPLPRTEEGDYYGVGPVLTCAPAPSGSDELASVAAACLGDSKAVLLGRHGVLAVGTGTGLALDVARVVEQQARIAWLLRGGGS